MSRDEVMRIVNDPVSDMREIKGFDAVHHVSTFLGEHYTWALLLRYDTAGRLKSAEARTPNSLFGQLDQKWSMTNTMSDADH